MQPLKSYGLYLLCPQGHALLRRKRVTLDDIGRHPLILPGEGAAIGSRVPEVFARNDAREPKVSLTSTNFALTITYVQMGYGVAVVPLAPDLATRWQPARHGRVMILDVRHLFGEEQIVMLHRVGGHELQHVTDFRETVIKALARG